MVLPEENGGPDVKRRRHDGDTVTVSLVSPSGQELCKVQLEKQHRLAELWKALLRARHGNEFDLVWRTQKLLFSSPVGEVGLEDGCCILAVRVGHVYQSTLATTLEAFAGITEDDAVVCWGKTDWGGDL